MDNLKTQQEFAQYLIDKEKDLGNLKMMQGIHDIVDMNWHMENKAWWITEQVSSDGYDSLKDAVDLMGTKFPRLTVTPYGQGDENRMQADAIEQVLTWQLDKLLNRRGSVSKQATRMAYKYGRVAAQLIYLPWQRESLNVLNGKQLETSKQYGDFALKVYDSREVFPYRTDYGLQGVLTKTILPQRELIDFWGKHANRAKRHMEENDLQWVTQFDLWTPKQRTVWCVPHPGVMYSARANEEGFEIINMENDLPFNPWIVSDLDDELRPMLYSAWKSGQWDLMNVYLSASSSEVTAYIAYPRYKITGPQGETVKIEMGEPGRPVIVPPGHDIEVLPPPGMDNSLTEKIMMLQGMVSKSTISHNVQTADFGSGAAYASIRELIDLSSRRLNDGKEILENFYSEVFIKMLRWIAFQETSVTAYLDDQYTGAKQVTLLSPAKLAETPDAGFGFDPDHLDFKVELSADIPEDQVARQNAASLFVQMGGSKAKALEMVGIQNPSAEIMRKRKEDVEEAKHQANLMMIQADAESRAAMIMQNAQMQAQQQAQQQMQTQQRNAGVGNEMLRGPAMAGGAGGMPADLGNPGTSSPPVQGGRNVSGNI